MLVQVKLNVNLLKMINNFLVASNILSMLVKLEKF